MNPLRILIIEDHALIREHTIEMVVLNGDQVVGQAGSIRQALNVIPMVKFDLILSDIHLPDGTVFDILNAVSIHKVPVIFITAYKEFAIEAIKAEAIDYILKPIAQEELYYGLDRARNRIQNVGLIISTEVIAINHYNSIQLISFTDIIYCRGEGGYTTFYLSDGRKVIASKYMKIFAEMLPEDLFIRTHQSFLINRNYIMEYKREGKVVLRNGSEIPVSTRSRIKVIEQLSKYKRLMNQLFLYLLLSFYGIDVEISVEKRQTIIDSLSRQMNITTTKLRNSNGFLRAHYFLNSVRRKEVKYMNWPEMASSYYKLRGIAFMYNCNLDSAHANHHFIQ